LYGGLSDQHMRELMPVVTVVAEMWSGKAERGARRGKKGE